MTTLERLNQVESNVTVTPNGIFTLFCPIIPIA